MFNTESFSFTMLLKIGIVPRSKSRQNTGILNGKDENEEDKPNPDLGERESSDLGELKPIVSKTPGSGWTGVKSSMSAADRRRRVSQIFGEATQLLAKQESLLRMLVNTTVVKYTSTLILTAVETLSTTLTSHLPNVLLTR